jgi:hypothetical protein
MYHKPGKQPPDSSLRRGQIKRGRTATHVSEELPELESGLLIRALDMSIDGLEQILQNCRLIPEPRVPCRSPAPLLNETIFWIRAVKNAGKLRSTKRPVKSRVGTLGTATRIIGQLIEF